MFRATGQKGTLVRPWPEATPSRQAWLTGKLGAGRGAMLVLINSKTRVVHGVMGREGGDPFSLGATWIPALAGMIVLASEQRRTWREMFA